MFASLKDYLHEKGNLTPEDLQLITNASVQKRVRKNQYLLEEGEVSDFVGFVVKGSFRLFRIGDDKEEHINRLVTRTVLDTQPITVQYELTAHGRSLQTIIANLTDWGLEHRKEITGKEQLPDRPVAQHDQVTV